MALALGSAGVVAQPADRIHGDGFELAFNVPESEAEAVRFLAQATMGARRADAADVLALGIDAWISREMTRSPTLTWPLMQQAFPCAAIRSCGRNERMDVWYWAAIGGQDQLRQRVAWALSQIFVVSDFSGPLEIDGDALAHYQDVLIRGAFKPYRELIEDVSLSPQMAIYLTMLYNQRADPTRNIRPDENFAREIMQLFSIGLWQLNADGSFRVDTTGQRLPTYDQDDVRAMARVFTGWAWADSGWYGPVQTWHLPLRIYRDDPPDSPDDVFGSFHDFLPKRYLGLDVPGQLTGEEDLRRALDRIANHPNTAPFISRQLIQKLVTSNPTPAYVARVVARWQATGGNLGEVVRAILSDVEARNGHRDPATRDSFGRLREPILRQTRLMRAFSARTPQGRPFSDWNPEGNWGQAPFRSPTVFYFYRPDYAPPGPVATGGRVAPEFQLMTESWIAQITTSIHYAVQFGGRVGNSSPDDHYVFDFGEEAVHRSNPAALVDHLDVKLMGGAMSPAMRQILIQHVGNVPMSMDDGYRRVRDAVLLVSSSPEYAIQR
jgi:uncharacterized protein (DUF1800 family)